MDRREFIGALALAMPAWRGLAQTPLAAKRVIIAGAGLAGLAAGLRLREAGWDVEILEARTRPGGRVYTLRESFSDGLYADAGAARIQDSHEFTLQYAKRFNLTLDPFWPTEGQAVTYIGGRRILSKQGAAMDLAEVPFDFSAEERKLGLRGGTAKYLFSHLAEVGDPLQPDWPSKDLSRFEVPIAEFAKQNGASAPFTRLLAFGHDLSGMSALHLLRDTVVAARTRQWFKIRGGTDRLPHALAATLSDRIRYGAYIVRLHQSDSGVSVTYLRDRTPVTVTGVFIVCALPAAVMKSIEVTPELPQAKKTAMHELGSLAMARVFLQTRRRFWRDRGESGWAATDDPMDIWDYTRDQPGQRGVLGAYLSGGIAHKVTAMAPIERGRFVLNRMEHVHPGVGEQFEASASYSWIEDPWARGASAEFAPGQMSRFYQTLRAPVGRIHFAGEYTSPWSGWMNGALESGHRVADAIIARHQ